MALDATHPHIVEYKGALGLITISKDDALAAIELHSQRQDANARIQRIHARVLAASAGLGAAASIAVGLLVLRLNGAELVPAILVGLVLGAVVGGLLNGIVERPTIGNPPPVNGIAPEVIEHAPRDASASDIARWTQQICGYQDALAALPPVRASVARKEYENYISPSDRSTWYYEPEGLARLEADLIVRRLEYERVAAELGFAPE